MKVSNLRPLLFCNIMVLLIPLLRSAKIILYFEPMAFPLVRTLWSFESGSWRKFLLLVTEKKMMVMFSFHLISYSSCVDLCNVVSHPQCFEPPAVTWKALFLRQFTDCHLREVPNPVFAPNMLEMSCVSPQSFPVTLGHVPKLQITVTCYYVM